VLQCPRMPGLTLVLLYRSPRPWLPNVQRKRLWSDTLNRMVQFNVTASALRWIDKAGGLDNYLLKTSPKKLDSALGMEYRRILQAIHREQATKAAAAAVVAEVEAAESTNEASA